MNQKQSHLVHGKLKIAILAPHFPPSGSGGVMSAHFNLYQRLSAQGFNVKVFTFLDSEKMKIRDPDPNVFRSGAPNVIRTFIKAATYFVFRLIEKCEVAYQVSDIFQAAWGSIKANVEIRKFNPDVLILPDQCSPGLYLKTTKHCKTIWISHHNPARFLGNPLLKFHSKKDADLAIKIENQVLKNVDCVICPSYYMMNTFKETYRYNGPVEMIPNMLEGNFIQSIPPSEIRLRIGLDPEDPLIYIPSAGSSLKGAHFVAEITRRVGACCEGDIGFYLSGKIPESLKHELSFVPKNVKLYMPGPVDYQTNIGNVKECTFTITPTLLESFGMAVIESLFCGVPVVAFDVGGVREVLRDKENGILVPCMDIEALILESRKLLLDRSLLEFLRKEASSTSFDHFNSEKIIQKWVLKLSPLDSINAIEATI